MYNLCNLKEQSKIKWKSLPLPLDFVSPPCLPAACFSMHLCTHTRHAAHIQTHAAHTRTPRYTCMHTHHTHTHCTYAHGTAHTLHTPPTHRAYTLTTHTSVHAYTVYTQYVRTRTHSLLLCRNIAHSAAALFVFPPPASPLQQCSKQAAWRAPPSLSL